jgi:tyrosyl-tRNA synthetase
VTEILFGDPEESLALLQNSTPAELKSIGQELGPYTLSNEEKNLIKNGELRLIDLCTASGLTPSNGEAKKLIQSGALFVNNKKSEAVDSLITTHDIQNNAFLLLRKGKKNYKIIFC